jgi:hypothetical protein
MVVVVWLGRLDDGGRGVKDVQRRLGRFVGVLFPISAHRGSATDRIDHIDRPREICIYTSTAQLAAHRSRHLDRRTHAAASGSPLATLAAPAIVKRRCHSFCL